MNERGTMKTDSCEKILASMRPAIRAFHHNQYLRKQRNLPPRSPEELYRLAKEKKNRKGMMISDSNTGKFPGKR
jgi:hypothetical protein